MEGIRTSGDTQKVSPLVAKIFASEDLFSLIDRAEIDKAAQVWDVGVPLVGDRPALDDTYLKAGLTHKERVNLSIGIGQQGQLTIGVTNRHPSRTDQSVHAIGVPVVSDAEDGSIFSGVNGSSLYGGLQLSIAIDGEVTLAGEGLPGEPDSEILFSDRASHNADYDRCINFAERMLRVPLLEGQFRAPIG